MADGWGSEIMHNETLFLLLDGAMCVLAIFLLTVFYPGFALKRKKDFVDGDSGAFGEEQIGLKDIKHGRRSRL
ncbi:unnamed protein product [Ambrosiozyma monospora]|uniref:Unnamed protein product n=1 Tax=Ambrosiozyma monospora TaxID=43982 RepID=A0ACB5SY95_AMBMO|nr:unnamed protein product [Ambrosiozyma monospora]